MTSGTYSFAYGTQNLSIQVASAGGAGVGGGLTTTANFAPGTVYTLLVGSGAFGAGTSVDTLSGNVTSGASTSYESTNSNFFISVAANTGAAVTTTNGFTVNFTVDGLSGSTLLTGTYTFNYGGQNITFQVNSGTSGAFDNTTIYHNGDQLTLNVVTGATWAAGASTGANVGYLGTSTFTSTLVTVSGYAFAGNTSNVIYASTSGTSGGDVNGIAGQSFLDSNLLGAVNKLTAALDTNLQKLRSYAQGLGTNVALLNTRLDFTSNYVNLLTAGSGKLTLADLNQEGANLLALQTRQQLGIQSLSFAGQNEKSILQLFR